MQIIFLHSHNPWLNRGRGWGGGGRERESERELFKIFISFIENVDEILNKKW